jgi:hypothetical protein
VRLFNLDSLKSSVYLLLLLCVSNMTVLCHHSKNKKTLNEETSTLNNMLSKLEWVSEWAVSCKVSFLLTLPRRHVLQCGVHCPSQTP